MGFITKFILPKTVDFISAIQEQSGLTRQIVQDLCKACNRQDPLTFESIREDAEKATALKKQNLQLLLNVFLTPYDKESIYRLFTQLDWVVLSVRHFVIEREVYGIDSLDEYGDILELLDGMAVALDDGCKQLSRVKITALEGMSEQVHDNYDLVVERCARATALHLQQDDCMTVLRHRDIIAQLKEIARRIHISADSLEDMVIKLG